MLVGFIHGPVTVQQTKGNSTMTTLGIDAPKRTHTVVAVDEIGGELGTRTTNATLSRRDPLSRSLAG